jgi:ATP-dependent Clp protease protease subunit
MYQLALTQMEKLMWDYNGFSKLQLDLIRERVVDMSGEVDGDMARYTREALLRLKAEGSPDVEIRITSGGGHVEYGLDIYDMIRLYKGKTRGVVFGPAASMAAIILQGCVHRCAAVHSHILIHHISRGQITLDDLRSTTRIAKIRAEMEKHQQRLYQILSERTGKSIPHIRKVCAKDKNMTPAEAKAFGLIDEIL